MPPTEVELPELLTDDSGVVTPKVLQAELNVEPAPIREPGDLCVTLLVLLPVSPVVSPDAVVCFCCWCCVAAAAAAATAGAGLCRLA